MSPAVVAASLEQMRTAKLVVFDFDGTLVDSNAIKRQAFGQCFAEFPDRLGQIRDYCSGQHHVPRGEKFQHVYEQILGQPYTSDVADRLHARFEASTTRQIIDAPEIPGASACLRWLRHRCRIALLSSTPQETLVHIVMARGWADYFRQIRGAPVDKAHWLQAARQRHALRGHELVYVGDCAEDWLAAERAGCAFIAVGSEPVGSALRIPDFMGVAEEALP